MLDERTVPRPAAHPRLEDQRPVRVRQESGADVMVPNLFERIIFVGVGSAIWITGFMLMLSILLVFIGLPLFFFGLAMTEAGLKGWR